MVAPRMMIAAWTCVTLFVSGCATTQTAPDTGPMGEPFPTFRAAQVLAPTMVRGSNYIVEDAVPVLEYRYLFRIRTDYGVIEALGRDMLDLRLHELRAMEAVATKSSASAAAKRILDAMKKSGRARDTVVASHDRPLVGVAKGFGQLVTLTVDAADQRAGGPARRRIALAMNCDPESSNPVLKDFLDQMELSAGSDKALFEEGTAPTAPELFRATDAQKAQLSEKAPHDIHTEIIEQLVAFGIGEYTAKKFCHDMNFTTLQRMIFAADLASMKLVNDRTSLVMAAMEARGEAEAIGTLRSAQMLAEIHLKRPLDRLYHTGLPIGYFKEGNAVVVCPVDYVTNTDQLVQGVSRFREENWSPSLFITIGRMSPAAKKTFADANIRVIENGETDL